MQAQENWPDIGTLQIIERKDDVEYGEIRHQAVELATAMLNKDLDYESFEKLATDLFSRLKMPPVMEGIQGTLNKETWKKAYAGLKDYLEKGAAIDLEVYSNENTYGNIYFATNNGLTMVVPGACSRPREMTVDKNGNLPERNFYEVVEEVLGVEPSRTQHTPDKQQFVFIVKDEQVIRIPLEKVDLNKGWASIEEAVNLG